MPIPPEIDALIERLNQELTLTEQKATEGVNLVRALLSRFPDNAISIELFAYLNNVLFFIQNYRRRIEGMVNRLSIADVTREEIQEIGEELGNMLGVALETKIRVERISDRLGDNP